MALSQSLPTPQIHEPARVVMSVAVGAPLAALPPMVAPLKLRSAPIKAATVIEPTYDPLCVPLTVTLDRTLGAAACQISAVPRWALVRWRNRQVRPPPVTELKL